MSGRNKILLNYIPPIRNVYPSAALSVIKSFMKSRGWDTDIKYWNIQLDSLMSHFPYNERRNLVPFLFLLSVDFNDSDSQKKIIEYLCNESRNNTAENALKISQHLKNCDIEIQNVFRIEFSKINTENLLVFGISVKFFQFIPAMYFARELKKKESQVKVVIGGIRNAFVAREYMEMCHYFDFAIWGEGEYPFHTLCEKLRDSKNDFENVPRLLYRNENAVFESQIKDSEYLDLKNYLMPDYEEYPFELSENSIIPINSIRSCYWDKCKFCIFGEDYAYRERSPESVGEEVSTMFTRYGKSKFHFIDNDIVGAKGARLIKLTEILIDIQKNHNTKFEFWGEVIHKNLTAIMFKGLANAGFKSLNFGIESLSEQQLRKIDKRTNIADTLFAIKHCINNGITPGGNIIFNFPDEEICNIEESINNLQFFRFFVNTDLPVSLSLQSRDFVLYKGTHYYNQISDSMREEHCINKIYDLLPAGFIAGRDRFNLFGFNRKIQHPAKWKEFDAMLSYYVKSKYSYSIELSNGSVFYNEFKAGKLIQKIELNSLQTELLTLLENNVYSEKKICEEACSVLPEATSERILSELHYLKDKALVYFHQEIKQYTSIISFQ